MAAWRLLERKPRTMPISVRHKTARRLGLRRGWAALWSAATRATIDRSSPRSGLRRRERLRGRRCQTPSAAAGYAETVERSALTTSLQSSITRPHVVIALRHV